MRFLANRWVHFLLLIIGLGAAIIWSFSDAAWRREMQFFVFDGYNQKYPRPATDKIIIVDIDDDSLERLGQWPWPRTIIAELIENLTAMEARVIAFDGVLAEPDRTSPAYLAEALGEDQKYSGLKDDLKRLPSHDMILAEAIRESDIFVTGFTFATYSQNPRAPQLKKPILIKAGDKELFLKRAANFRAAATFLPEVEAAAAGNGSFMATPDHDGVLRRTGLVFSDGAKLYPALSLEALRVGGAHAKSSYKIGRTPDQERRELDTDYRLILGDTVIPLEEDGRIYMYYRPFSHENGDYLSAYKVIDPEYRDRVSALVKDKYILVGASAEGLKDLRSTALEAFQPGVEIHANALEQILQGNFLLRPNEIIMAEANFILAAGLLMIFLAPFIHVIVLGFCCFFLIAVAFYGAEWAYVEHGLLLDPFYPSLCVFLLFVFSTIMTYLRVESEKAHVREAFGLYISPDFMKELTKNPGKLKLGGEIKDLTVMFTDIRSFTTISEGLTPEELIQLMNDFLTPMSDLVMQNRGTIDKYMGDAMMAFWNAPLDDPDHERHACRAALGMQAALEPINKGVKERAAEKGKEPVLLQAGIGINTGPCAVGNMGSRQRFAYSTLGDAVNLASRLEGQTKNYGVSILIGESTWEKVQDFATLEMDFIRVKGKTKAERIFALLGDETLAQDNNFKALKDIHEKMISAYQKGDFKAAQKHLETGRKRDVYNLGGVYDLYEQRIKKLLKKPPEGKWDGVYEAKTK